MSLLDHLPVSESIGVFVGIAGFDWLAEGRAEPLKALISAVAAGAIIAIARWWQRSRRQR